MSYQIIDIVNLMIIRAQGIQIDITKKENRITIATNQVYTSLRDSLYCGNLALSGGR